MKKYIQPKKDIFFIPEDRLDFHYLDKFDSFEIETRADQFIEDSYIRKLKNVIIIVGKGEVIRPFVKKILERNKFIEEFRAARYENGGSGAFEVTIKDFIK